MLHDLISRILWSFCIMSIDSKQIILQRRCDFYDKITNIKATIFVESTSFSNIWVQFSNQGIGSIVKHISIIIVSTKGYIQTIQLQNVFFKRNKLGIFS